MEAPSNKSRAGWFPRLNGWALSLLLHGLVGGLAALSVFGVSSVSGGGGGGGVDRAGSWGGRTDLYRATMKNDEFISGQPLGDPAQYGRLTEDVPEPALDDVPVLLPAPDGADAVEVIPQPLDPPSPRPARAADRGARLRPTNH